MLLFEVDVIPLKSIAFADYAFDFARAHPGESTEGEEDNLGSYVFFS